jgi:signal transduction histidine kinase
MFNKLTTRLVASHLIVISIAMTLLGFLLLSLVQSYFEQALQTSLTTQARLTAQALVSSNASNLAQVPLPAAQNVIQQSQITAPTQNISPTLDNTTLRLSAELETRIRVVDTRGIVQADSANAERGRDLSNDPAIAAALRGQELARTLDDSIFVAVPLRRDARIVGAVYLSQPMRDVAAVLADLRARLLVSAAIALALSALVGLMLARAIARPVRELTRAAHRLAQGDFDYPLPDKSSDELGELARAFRAMSGELRRTLQARTDLVSNVSHELRTPLTAIKGLIETLRDGAVDDLNARDKFLASIESETDRLIRLVNDLLVLSRADSQALTLHREKFDLTALARACADEFAARRVTILVDGQPTPVNADPDRIRQVLVNLLDNAIRFSPPDEIVRVSIASASDGVAVAVQDRGPGIPAAEQARVFERFYRADKSRARDAGAGGAGLGLSIAQTLIQAHGGHIALTSHAGRGTTVRFTLPAS